MIVSDYAYLAPLVGTFVLSSAVDFDDFFSVRTV